MCSLVTSDLNLLMATCVTHLNFYLFIYFYLFIFTGRLEAHECSETFNSSVIIGHKV